MAESKIKVMMEGVDNASNVIKKVKGELDQMGVAANANAQNLQKGGDAVKAAMSAANGSVSGAIGAVKGMSNAIQGMGVAINTALPIALAIAAAIFAIKKAYDAIQASHQKEIDNIKEETKARLEQQKAIDKAASAMQDLISHQERMAKINLQLAGGDAVDTKSVEASTLRKRDKAYATEIEQRQGTASDIQDQLTKLQLKSLSASGKDKEVFAEQQKELEKALQEEKDKILKLNREREYIAKQLQLNAQEQQKLIEAEEEEAKTRIAAAKKALQDASKKESEESKARNRQLMMMQLDVKGADQGERAKLQALFMKQDIDAIRAEKERVQKEWENAPLGDAKVQLAFLYRKLAGDEEVAIKQLEAHNAIEERRIAEEKKREEEKAAAEKKKTKLAQLQAKLQEQQAALQKELKKGTQQQLSQLFQSGSHSTNLLLDRLAGQGKDTSSMQVNQNVKNIYDTLKDLTNQIKKLQVA